MDSTVKKIRKTGLKYGISGGVVTVLFLMLVAYLGTNILDPSLTLLVSAVIALFIVFAFVEHRQLERQTRFWKNMTLGIMIYLIIGIFSAVFVFIMVVWVDQDLAPKYINDRAAMMMENKQNFIDQFDEQTFEETLDDLRQTKPHHLAIDRFMRDAFTGLFITILISAIFHFIYNRKTFTTPKL